MKTSQAEMEQRMLSILKADARKSMLEISRELRISRITAKKMLESLVQSGKIRNFTINTEDDERDLVLVQLTDMKKIPAELVVESFSLVDRTYIVVMYYENLLKVKDIDIIDVKIAHRRLVSSNSGRKQNVHCDYCGAIISSSPISITAEGRIYYACCPNCERDLKRRLVGLENTEKTVVSSM